MNSNGAEALLKVFYIYHWYYINIISLLLLYFYVWFYSIVFITIIMIIYNIYLTRMNSNGAEALLKVFFLKIFITIITLLLLLLYFHVWFYSIDLYIFIDHIYITYYRTIFEIRQWGNRTVNSFCSNYYIFDLVTVFSRITPLGTLIIDAKEILPWILPISSYVSDLPESLSSHCGITGLYWLHLHYLAGNCLATANLLSLNAWTVLIDTIFVIY